MDIIFLLQETQSDEIGSNIWLKEWGGLGIFAHENNTSRGTAILFRPGLNIEIRQVEICKRGRFVAVGTSINGSHLSLISVYGPNINNPSEFHAMFEACENIGDEDMIIGGDFNFRFDLNLDHDSRARTIANNHRCKAAVLQYMTARKLVDVWRSLHSHAKNFTFHQAASGVKSRIDFSSSAINTCTR